MNQEQGNLSSRIESICNDTLGRVYKKFGRHLLELSKKDNILTEEDEVLSMIAINALVTYFSYVDEFVDGGVLGHERLGKVYNSCGKELFDLAKKDTNLNSKDKHLAMIAVLSLVDYYIHTANIDNELFCINSSTLDYDECSLICVKKIHNYKKLLDLDPI